MSQENHIFKSKTTSTVKKLKQKREKSTSEIGFYVRNADLMPAIATAKEKGVVTNELILMIKKIAERYSRKGNFIGYSFREDMVSAAVENMCKNALKFDSTRYSNPFAYYTTGIHNSFLQYMADEKRHRNIRDALLIDAGSNPSFNFMQGEKDETHFEVKESDEGSVHDRNLLRDNEELLHPTAEVKIRYEGRVPGTVTRWLPGEFELDPETGLYRKKAVEEIIPVKKLRKPAVKKVVEEKPIAKKVSKVPTKKIVAKKVVKKITKVK